MIIEQEEIFKKYKHMERRVAAMTDNLIRIMSTQIASTIRTYEGYIIQIASTIRTYEG